MAHIHITYIGVSSSNRILRKVIPELVQMEENYDFLGKAIAPEIQLRYQIGDRLRACRQVAEDICQATRGVLGVAEAGLLEYRMTEVELNRNVPVDDEILEMR